MNARLSDRGSTGDRLRVLVLTRPYPNDVLPTLAPWAEMLTRHLAERCDVRVVAPSPWCPPLPPIPRLRQYSRFRDVEREETRNGISVNRPRLLVGPGRALYRFEASSFERATRDTINRIHREFPFDLVHAHFIYPDGTAAYRVAQRYGVPFVITEHAPWHPWLTTPSIGRQALPAARAAAMILPESTSVRMTMEHFGLDRSRLRVVPVGVDTSLFRPDPKTRRDPDQILQVGFINFNKGVDVLLRAMKMILAKRPSAHLALLGGSHFRDTALQEEKLRAMAGDLGLTDRVRFLGLRPHAEVPEHMRASSVVTLASRAESFGAVLAEAISCGTPVVATRCGGPEDFVTPEVGRLVPTEDPTALATAVLDVLEHRDRFDPQRLHAYIVENFSWSSVAARHVEAFQEALGLQGSMKGIDRDDVG